VHWQKWTKKPAQNSKKLPNRNAGNGTPQTINRKLTWVQLGDKRWLVAQSAVAFFKPKGKSPFSHNSFCPTCDSKRKVITRKLIIRSVIVAVFCMFELESILFLGANGLLEFNGLLVSPVMMMFVVGNFLICIAVFYDKSTELKLKKMLLGKNHAS
jgi:hypothetical protein